jgi:hypothetical protein
MIIGPRLVWSRVENTIYTNVDSSPGSDRYSGIEASQRPRTAERRGEKSRVGSKVLRQGEWEKGGFVRLLDNWSPIGGRVVHQRQFANAMDSRY